MRDELQAWNNGSGIDLDGWRSCTGNFSLAVGYTTVFNPSFVAFEDYIFAVDEITERFVKTIRGFEKGVNNHPAGVEWVINHEHIADLQYAGCEDLSKDKILIIGDALKEIYEAKLAYIFPDRPCVVEFYKPEDEDDLGEYQISFWQKNMKQTTYNKASQADSAVAGGVITRISP